MSRRLFDLLGLIGLVLLFAIAARALHAGAAARRHAPPQTVTVELWPGSYAVPARDRFQPGEIT